MVVFGRDCSRAGTQPLLPWSRRKRPRPLTSFLVVAAFAALSLIAVSALARPVAIDPENRDLSSGGRVRIQGKALPFNQPGAAEGTEGAEEGVQVLQGQASQGSGMSETLWVAFLWIAAVASVICVVPMLISCVLSATGYSR